MRIDKNKTRRVGKLMLDAIMLAFVLTFSWADEKVIDHNEKNKLTISASPLDQLAFRDLNSFSVPFLYKVQFANNESSDVVINYPSFETATRVAFLITSSLYNTFYTNTTINAP